MKLLAWSFLGAFLVATTASEARACGCFAITCPTANIVQGRERILFAVDGSEVVAHIQVWFAGADTTPSCASTFSWLLPLPSLPKVESGSVAIFDDLVTATQPRFDLVTEDSCDPQTALRNARGGGSGGGGCACGPMAAPIAAANPAASQSTGGPDLVVAKGAVGTSSYVVIHADQKADVTAWLTANGYFVPTATDVLAQYVHPGAYFLAVKITPNGSAGDLTPIVLRYPSDLPMIPLALTSVTSASELPVSVYVLGGARAISRNYQNVVLDTAALDWTAASRGYEALVRRAVGETSMGRAFTTEFAGPSATVKTSSSALTTLLAGRPWLTRFYARLDPRDMTVDPVFSFDPDLASVPRAHGATLRYDCQGNAILTTDEGYQVPYPHGRPPALSSLPAASRVENLREAGPPELVLDNHDRITAILAGMAPPPVNSDGGTDGGVSLHERGADRRGMLALTLVPLLLALWRARRRG